MEFLRLSLLYIHLIGMALVVGGTAVALFAKQYQINKAMLVGIITQLITGVALCAPLGRDEQPSSAKLAVKLVLAILLAIMIIIPRKREKVNPGHFMGIGALSVITVGVAVFWT
ncbi:MAG: hypothetical protein HOQ05_01640 [Corynebacteriales bacterium]|nr:hypothetical protein [Mycobacteriales bacterium]